MLDCHRPEERALIEKNIEQFGCHIVFLEETDYLPAFAYSIGLFKKFNHPEIICFGLGQSVLAAVINHGCDLIRAGENLVPEKLYDGFLANYKIQFLTVDKNYYQNYLGYGGWFYDMGFDFPAVQLVWPDKQSLFPWQDGFNPNWLFKQPLLDRNIDFKFYEARNLGVFTTSQVLNGEHILYVYHNKDGDWQFHSRDAPNIGDVKLVCLEEITKIDPTVNEVFHLRFGWSAWRGSVNDDWEYAEDQNNDE